MKEMDSDHRSAPQNNGGYSTNIGASSNSKLTPRTTLDGLSYHFEMPNLSSMLYEFTNKEKDLVEKWWRVGNYHSLRDLPVTLGPGNVIKSFQEKQDLAHLPVKPKRMTALSDGGYFSKFDWQPDPYLEIKNTTMTKSKFIAGSRLAPLKYEGLFGAVDEHVLPFFIDIDPYEATIEEVLKNKWMEESKKLHGDFILNSKEHFVQNKTNRNALGDIVAYMKKTILSDWHDINFVIGTNPEEMIEVKFDGKTIDSTKGLHAYMNTMIHSNEEVMQYDLRRVIHYWGYKEGQYIYYMLAPSWIKLKINDIMNFYKKVEPKTRSSFDSLSESEEKFDKRLAARAQGHKPVLYSRNI